MPLKDDFIDGEFYTAADINAVAAAVNSLDADTLGMFNVKAYGAIGDGIADDSGAIQAAIDAASGGWDSGGVVYFPVGNYRLASTLLVNEPNVTLMGASVGSTKLLLAASANFPAITFSGHLDGVPATPTNNGTFPWNFSIREMWIEKETPVVNGAPAISLFCIQMARLHNIQIRGFGTGILCSASFNVYGHQVNIQSNSAATIPELYGWKFDSDYANFSCYLSHCTAGFGGENVATVESYGYYNAGTHPSDWFLDHCEAGVCTVGFYYSGNTAAAISDVFDIHFVGCIADQCQYGFLILDNLSPGATGGQVDIDSCYWANRFTTVVPTPNGQGVGIGNCSGVTVRGFQAYSGNPADPTHYQDNYGIFVSNSKDVSITGANIKGNALQGIYVDTSEFVTVFGNTILQTLSIAANGIALVNGTDASVVGNTIRSLSGLATPMANGIYVNAHGGVVIGNNVVDSATVTNELTVTGGAAVSAVNNIGFADYP